MGSWTNKTTITASTEEKKHKSHFPIWWILTRLKLLREGEKVICEWNIDSISSLVLFTIFICIQHPRPILLGEAPFKSDTILVLGRKRCIRYYSSCSWSVCVRGILNGKMMSEFKRLKYPSARRSPWKALETSIVCSHNCSDKTKGGRKEALSKQEKSNARQAHCLRLNISTNRIFVIKYRKLYRLLLDWSVSV